MFTIYLDGEAETLISELSEKALAGTLNRDETDIYRKIRKALQQLNVGIGAFPSGHHSPVWATFPFDEAGVIDGAIESEPAVADLSVRFMLKEVATASSNLGDDGRLVE